MKTLILISFLFCFFVNASFAATMCDVDYHDQDGGCYERMVCREVDIGSCSTGTGTTTHDLPGCAYPCSVCGVVDYCSPSSLCDLFTNSVGGCDNTPKYCSTSPVYAEVASFLGVLGADTTSWTYFTSIGSDNNIYKCIRTKTDSNGKTYILFLAPINWEFNPVGSQSCISEVGFNALKNTNCSLSTGWAINTGLYTNNPGKTSTVDPAQVEGPAVPAGTTPVNPSGDPITSPTGVDENKDGWDDITGQPVGLGSGVKDSDGDGTGEVEIKDPDPSEIPAVPSAPDDDTSIESPEQKDLVELFDIFATSPFVSLFSGQHVLLSGMVCSLSAEVYGKTITFDFCDSRIADLLDWLGAFLVGYAALVGLISIFN